MSPKLDLKYRDYVFFFYSKEEQRPHVHVARGSSKGAASSKFWLTKDGVELASNGAHLSDVELRRLEKFLSANKDFALARWTEFFVM